MIAVETKDAIQSLCLQKEIDVAAPIEIAFAALLEELGPENEGPPGKPMPMVLEAWPGGRWFRDLADKTGHLWGHVQVIKPPTLLEITGPLFMSYAAANHVQYRLVADGAGTKISFAHRAIGQIPREHQEGVRAGWQSILERIRTASEKSAAGR